MNNSYQINADDTLKKLATGISLLQLPVRQIPDILELGVRELQALYLCNLKLSLPSSRYDLFKVFEKPISEWWPLELPTADPYDRLLFMGQPTPFCMDWALERGSLSKQLAEIDEQVMARFVEICRMSPISFQSIYVATRKFLIENPIVFQKDLTHQIAINHVHDIIQGAYEVVPTECIHDGFCYICDHCKDALIWHNDQAYCRNWSVCEKLGGYTFQTKIKAKPDIRRVKRGIMAYITLPGLPEIELSQRIKELGFASVLWPGIDEYDLLISLPGEENWAVDVKATRSPKALGEREVSKGFIPNRGLPGLEWDRAFYVIPDIYYDSSFLDQFRKGARINSRDLAKRKIELMSMKVFLRTLEGKIKNAAN